MIKSRRGGCTPPHNQHPYSKDELNAAVPAYLFVVVYLLAIIPNDFRLLDAGALLGVIITGRIIVSVVILSVVTTILVPRFRQWYLPLNGLAFVSTVALQPLVLYTRPEITSYSLLPTLIIMAVMFFLIPAPLPLKIFLSVVLTTSDLSQMVYRHSFTISEQWTFGISYLGLIGMGITHELRMRTLRRYRAAYRQRIDDDIRFKEALANSSFQGILLVDDGIVRDLNQSVVEMIGRPREEILGIPVSTVYRIDKSGPDRRRDPEHQREPERRNMTERRGGTDRRRNANGTVLSSGHPALGEAPEPLEGWILGEDGQETPVRLTMRDVPVDNTTYRAVLVEDRTQETLGTREEKERLSAAAIETRTLPLTKRERQITACLLQGTTRQQIAERLYISDETVKSHIAHIYRKLKVRSRVELAQRVQGEDEDRTDVLRSPVPTPTSRPGSPG